MSRGGSLPNRFLFLGRRYAARLGFRLGLGQEPESRLAPSPIDADIEQGVGTSAWAGKIHDRDDTVGLPGLQRDRPTRDVVRGGIDAENEVARTDSVTHSFHP